MTPPPILPCFAADPMTSPCHVNPALPDVSLNCMDKVTPEVYIHTSNDVKDFAYIPLNLAVDFTSPILTSAKLALVRSTCFKDIPISFPLRAFCCKNSLNAANVVNAFMSAADTHDVSHAQRSAGVHLFKLANGFACIPVSGTICES